MSILSDIGAFFLGVGTKTLTFIMGTVKALEDNPQVQDIATAEVAKAEDAVLTGVEAGSVAAGVAKFTAAQTGVVAQLTAAGVPVVLSQVNLAIEAAVANLKVAQASAAPTPAADPAPATDPAPAPAAADPASAPAA